MLGRLGDIPANGEFDDEDEVDDQAQIGVKVVRKVPSGLFTSRTVTAILIRMSRPTPSSVAV